jgi:hypothetical protein
MPKQRINLKDGATVRTPIACDCGQRFELTIKAEVGMSAGIVTLTMELPDEAEEVVQ